jgi:SAM-dependent methyltransferase
VFSSHCIEHMVDPTRALKAWWDLVKPGGHLVVIAPSWGHYERKVWPPRFNTDHKTAWDLYLTGEVESFRRGLVNECGSLGGTIIRALTLDEHWRPGEFDQTSTHESESSFEVVVQKAPA